MLRFFHPNIRPGADALSESPAVRCSITAILTSPTPRQALRIFRSASRSNLTPGETLRLHSAIVHVLTAAKLFASASRLIEGLIEALIRNRPPHDVRSSIFNSLAAVKSPPCSNANVLEVLMVALCRKGLPSEGYRVYQAIEKKSPPAVQACNTLLNGLIKAGQVERMWEVHRDMISNGLTPNEITHGILIYASCDQGNTNKAELLLEEMIERGLKPTVVVYTILLGGLCRENNMPKAEIVFKRMQHLGISPNLYSYNTLMGGYAKIGNYEKTQRVYREMLDRNLSPNVVTFGILTYLLCRSSETAIFRGFFPHMVKLNVVPNAYVYNCLMDGFCEAGDGSAAMETYAEMQKFNIPPNVVTHGILMKVRCRSGEVEEAEDLLSKMNRDVVNTVAYNTLIDGYCKRGNMEKAAAIYTQMMEKKLEPNVVTFCILIDGYCRIGKLEAATGLHREMVTSRGLGLDVVAYTCLIEGYFKHGYADSALELLRQMESSGVAPNAFTINTVIDGLCKEGRISKAIDFFRKKIVPRLSGAEAEDDHLGYNISYSILINALWRNGRSFKAIELFKDMRKRDIQPDTYTYSAIIQEPIADDKDTLPVMMMQADATKRGAC